MTRIASIVTLLLVLATACTRGGTTIAGTSPSPTVSTSPDSVAWSDCGGGFQCGSVKVPLDYSNPSGDTIQIALIRKRATDPLHRIGSVLTNPGGPGGSGIDFLKSSADSMKNLNQRFDLVSFDPRGVGKSAPIRCLTGPQEDAYNALDPVLDDYQEKQAAIQTDKDFAAGCESMSGKLLPFVDTPSAARDMDAIRAAVGDATLTYLGFSYGTYLGQWYAHLFPTHVRALSLDGVVDPTLSANDMALAQAAAFDQNLQAFLTDCRARTSCQFGHPGDPEAKLFALMQAIDATPLTVGSRLLTRALAVVGVLRTLYNPSYWAYLDLGLTAAERGDGRLLLALADDYLGRNADGTYDNEIDANFAINCLDHPVPTDIAVYDQLGPAYAKAAPFFGPPQQYSNFGCAPWPVKPTGRPGPLSANGAPPILLVGGTNDPATPYAWAQSVNQQLAGSVLLTRQGYGHVSYFQSTCAQQAEDLYLINLTLPAPGTVCTD